MFTKTVRRVVVRSMFVALVAMVACGRRGSGDPALEGMARIALTEVPADVACVRITVAGSRTVQQGFDVKPGASSVLQMTGLPLGSVSVLGEAFDTACPAVTPTKTPGWVSDPTPATLVADRVVDVTLTMKRNGQALVGVAFDRDDLWGWADLHTHPGSHLAFGSDSDGHDGIFFGSPGRRLEDAPLSIFTDLPACSADKHSGFDADHVKTLTRRALMQTLNQITGQTHSSSGPSAFETWPHALSLTHQQMHISFIHRAYQGGLRLLFASVTNSQPLSMLWNQGYNAAATYPSPVPGFDFDSAKKQLNFIRDLASANSSWMQIVTSSAEARDAISKNKLAIVLSVEMDTTSAGEIDQLRADFGVRHVVPVHLVDNTFGGTAVYSDVFNSANWYLNGNFFQVQPAPLLNFRLGRPQTLVLSSIDLLEGGAVQPHLVSRIEHCLLGYIECPDFPDPLAVPWEAGHRNRRGANLGELRKLMAAGLMVDVAHMSEAATGELLAYANRLSYPLMDSHTDIREVGVNGKSERSLLAAHAHSIALQGGVIGLGTEAKLQPSVILLEQGGFAESGPIVRFTGDVQSWSRQLPFANTGGANPVIDTLSVTSLTGDDDLRGGNDNAFFRVFLRDGTMLESDFNHTASFSPHTTHVESVSLPSGTRLHDVIALGFRTTFGGGSGGDNWDLTNLTVDYSGPNSANGELLGRSGNPFFRFTGDIGTWKETMRWPEDQPSPNTPLRKLILTIHTGDDDLRGGDDNAFVTINLRDGRQFENDFNRGASISPHSTTVQDVEIADNTLLGDIMSVTMKGTFSSDNWDLESITLEAEAMDGTRYTLTQHNGAPYMRLTGTRRWMSLYTGFPDEVSVRSAAPYLRILIRTGGDDLRTDSVANATVELASGTTLRFPLNRSGNWVNESVYGRIIALPAGTRPTDLVRIGIESNLGSPNGDNWDVEEVRLELIEDPVANWLADYQRALGLMGYRGVALGTDINGFASQIPFTADPVSYPIDVANKRAPAAIKSSTPLLDRAVLGSRTFDVHHDGIAHYGLLPDFLQAVAQRPTADASMNVLFRSAEDVVRMWERVEKAAPLVPPGP